MKVKIITTDRKVAGWRTLRRKLKNITDTLSTIKNVSPVKVELITRTDLKPRVLNGRVTHSFMETLTDEYTKDGEAFVMLHMSEKQKESLGIKPTLRGAAFRDGNFFSEAYFWADEYTKRGRYNQFEETCLHELSHLLYHRSGAKDITHEWHDRHGTIKGLFKHHDFLSYQYGVVYKIASWLKNNFGSWGLQPLVKRQADEIVKEMEDLGHPVHIFDGFRSIAKQDQLYAQGRTLPGDIVTNARGGESFHNYGVAVDIVFGTKGNPSWSPKNPWATLGKVGKKHGFEWGGDWAGFVDKPHFQMPMGYTIQDFKNKKVDYTRFV